MVQYIDLSYYPALCEKKSFIAMIKKAVLLVNLGTPEAPDFQSVKRYLTEFLLDPDVLELPWISRQILVRGVIIPKRCATVAASYQKIWTEEGSPLKVYTQRVATALYSRLVKEGWIVKWAMRYQNPSMEEALKELQREKIEHLVVLPLFPQYANATTGSIIVKLNSVLKKIKYTPSLKVIPHFYHSKEMIETLAAHALPLLKKSDHVLISFHGLPKRQAEKSCYPLQCQLTADALVKELKLKEGDYSICFQSRLGKEKWLEPYASDALKRLAHEGKKRLLVFSPSFVCDCLETLYEIGEEYKKEFEEHGGEALTLVEGLNDDPHWILALREILLSTVANYTEMN